MGIAHPTRKEFQSFCHECIRDTYISVFGPQFFSCVLHLASSSSAAFFVETQTVKGNVLRTIVIDPGHGGEDTGAVGPSGIKEKDINLAIAMRLKKLLAEKTNAIVILTRADDRFIPLDERTNIANKNEADLFMGLMGTHPNFFNLFSLERELYRGNRMKTLIGYLN